MRRSFVVLAVLFLVAICLRACPAVADTFSFTTLDDPLGVNGTAATGISGNNIVGYYLDASNTRHEFLYNGSTYTTINTLGTIAGIDGNNVVGTYQAASNVQNGFVYNISTSAYTIISEPLATNNLTYATAISGNIVVGIYGAGTQPGNPATGTTGYNGYIYNLSTSAYTTLDNPLGVRGTLPYGISGNDIVGTYGDANASAGNHGFLYDGSTWTTIDDPLGLNGDAPAGISGNTIFGYYLDTVSGKAHGFLYDMPTSTYTTLDDPLGANGTGVTGISGNTIVGSYDDASGVAHGFVATPTPEPSTFVLFAAGAIGLAGYAWRRRKNLANESSGQDESEAPAILSFSIRWTEAVRRAA